LEQFKRDPMRGVFEAAIPLAMPNDILTRILSDGKGSRRPDLSGFFIPNVNNLTGWIANRVIRPGGQLVFPAVD
jgi:hypothetical protein